MRKVTHSQTTTEEWLAWNSNAASLVIGPEILTTHYGLFLKIILLKQKVPKTQGNSSYASSLESGVGHNQSKMFTFPGDIFNHPHFNNLKNSQLFVIPNLETVLRRSMWKSRALGKFLESISLRTGFSQAGISVFGDLFIQRDSDMSWCEQVPKAGMPAATSAMNGAVPHYLQCFPGFLTRRLQKQAAKFRGK